MDIDLRKLRGLLRTLAEADVTEFEFEDESIRLRIGIGARPVVEVAPRALAPQLLDAPLAARVPETGAPQAQAHGDDPSLTVLTSPFVGTFYRAPAPEAPPFVEMGSKVRPGQTVCIIEAMKLMNEIEAECAGEVAEILVDNGKPVEYGQPLFRIRKL